MADQNGNQTTLSGEAGREANKTDGNSIPPELLDEVTKRVYKLLMQEMAIDRERVRFLRK